MRPEQMARLVARWVRFYTSGLPLPIAERRISELDADLHDQIAHERSRKTSDWRIVLSILSRMARGMSADASWRSLQVRAIRNPPPTAGEAMKSGTLSYRSVVRVLVVVAVILLVPLLAMQLTDEVAWTVSDFAIAGVLLAATGLLYEVAASRAGSLTYRAAVAVALGAGLFLVWAVLAVGAIGAEGDPADLMYFGVLAVGIVGAVMVRLDPNGMVRVLLVMALGIAVVAIVALIAGRHLSPQSSVSEILAVNAFFAALFTASAWLFRRAAHDQRLRGAAHRA